MQGNDYEDPTGGRSFFSTDGEAIILNQGLDPDVLAAFREAKIDYLKGAPSGTHKHQPADVSTNFRDIKTGMNHVATNNTNTYNASLRKASERAFQEFETKFAAASSSSSSSSSSAAAASPRLSANLRYRIIIGIERLIHVLRAKYFTSIKIIEGFERCGQHIREPGDDGCTVSFEGIMQQSTATVLKKILIS